MSPLGVRYPVVLQAVINHAYRLRDVLEERERRAHPNDRGGPWLIGRAGELQCVVALVALDWHHERLTGEAAASKLAKYVREIHDGLAMHLDIEMPRCCRLPLARASGRREGKRPIQPAIPAR